MTLCAVMCCPEACNGYEYLTTVYIGLTLFDDLSQEALCVSWDISKKRHLYCEDCLIPAKQYMKGTAKNTPFFFCGLIFY